MYIIRAPQCPSRGGVNSFSLVLTGERGGKPSIFPLALMLKSCDCNMRHKSISYVVSGRT